MSKWKLFLLSLFLTIGVALEYFYLHRPGEAWSRVPKVVRIADDLYISSQLRSENVPALKRGGIKTIVDIRPDGEAADQAPSAEIKTVSIGNGLGFHYIPVPHENIPFSAVEALDQALSAEALPALLYCRTGRRAVRLFALVQASRVDGPGADEIMEMVRAAGFSADDLRDEIRQRLSHRKKAPAADNSNQTASP
jgi:uncharacterized protein (TIGR01244 family)